MEGTDYTFGQKDRVRLKDISPEFYGGWACVGNEATVKHRRKDKNGLPEIYVEWDKNHWAYNNAPDGWTFQEHFELVEKAEQQMASDDDKEKKDKIADWLSNVEGQPATDEEDYDTTVSKVSDMLSRCESFVVIGVMRESHPDAEGGLLVPMIMENSKNQESELVTMLAASQVASAAHTELTVHAITALQQKKR